MKVELLRKEEEMAITRRNTKATRFVELESELNVYKNELLRLRFVLENNFGNY